MKRILYSLAVSGCLLTQSAFAAQPADGTADIQDNVPAVNAAEVPPAAPDRKPGPLKKEFENHFSLYGFIRNYFAFDSRESASGTGNLFYYLPFDQNLNELGEDLNAQPSFRFLSITSRVGLDVNGYRVGKTDISAKVETDFYAGLSGSTGTATLRLRQAYMKLGWRDLPMCGGNTAAVTLLMGQAWHPMAADQPDVISLAVGAPFNPFNRSPQVTMDANLGKHFTLTGAFVYQMQYVSAGPEGSSANYMKYGILPEFYAGITYRAGGFMAKAGASVLSIKPRTTGTAMNEGQEVERKVSDRLNAVSPFVYLQYKQKAFTLKAKTVYGSAADYLNLVSGYGISYMDPEDGHYNYTASHTSSSWISASYGKKFQGMLMLGYITNLGTGRDMVDTGSDSYYFFSKDGGNFRNLAQAFRVVPAFTYNIGKFTLGLEYEVTSAQYGSHLNADGTVMKDGESITALNGVQASRHWITNHRIQFMTKFTF